MDMIGDDGLLPLAMSIRHREMLESAAGRRLLQTSPPPSNQILVKTVVVVSKGQKGNFTTIEAAVAAAPDNSDGKSGYYLIYVNAGVYEEYVSVPKNKKYVMMVGDGISRTIITGNRNVVDGSTTYDSATFGTSPLKTSLLSSETLTWTRFCSGGWSGIRGRQRDVQEHCRPGEAPGGGGPQRRGPVRVLSLQLRGVPGHALRALPPAVLPAVRRLRHRRLHLRQRGRRLPGVQLVRETPHEQPEEHGDSPGEDGSEPEHGHFDPGLQDPGGAGFS